MSEDTRYWLAAYVTMITIPAAALFSAATGTLGYYMMGVVVATVMFLKRILYPTRLTHSQVIVSVPIELVFWPAVIVIDVASAYRRARLNIPKGPGV